MKIAERLARLLQRDFRSQQYSKGLIVIEMLYGNNLETQRPTVSAATRLVAPKLRRTSLRLLLHEASKGHKIASHMKFALQLQNQKQQVQHILCTSSTLEYKKMRYIPPLTGEHK